MEMIGPLSRFVVRDDFWLVELCHSFAKSGDLEMLKALEEFIIHDDRYLVHLNLTLAAAAEGCFAAVLHLLCWWRGMSEAPNPITDTNPRRHPVLCSQARRCEDGAVV